MGKELLEAKRIEEENERKRCTFIHIVCLFWVLQAFISSYRSKKKLSYTLTDCWPCGKLRKRKREELGKKFDKNWKKIRS